MGFRQISPSLIHRLSLAVKGLRVYYPMTLIIQAVVVQRMNLTTGSILRTNHGAAQRALMALSMGVFLVLALVGIAPTAASSELQRMLQGEREVESQTRNERQQVLPTIFSDVLVRVSGTEAVLQNSQIRAELRNVNDYLLQFGYRTDEDTLYLLATFDESRVRDLLQRAGFTLWTGRRPQLLLWIAENHPERGVRLVSRAEQRPLIEKLRQASERRGLPMMMPLMDLQDQMAITPRDVWGRFEREILQASTRYPTEGVVSARVFRQAADASDGILLEPEDESAANYLPEELEVDAAYHYILEARVSIGDMRFVEVIEAADEGELVTEFVNRVADRVSALFIGETSEGTSEILVRMRGLQQLAHVLQAEQMLQQQGQVYRVQLRRYQQGTAEFAVQLNGGASWLAQALEFDRRIEREALNTDADISASEVALEFRWVR